MSQKARSTFVCSALVRSLLRWWVSKDVAVVRLERRGPDVELMIEQVVDDVRCPNCAERAQVKVRPVVHYVDLPVYGVPMSLAWKKHRMRCVNPRCADTYTRSVADHTLSEWSREFSEALIRYRSVSGLVHMGGTSNGRYRVAVCGPACWVEQSRWRPILKR